MKSFLHNKQFLFPAKMIAGASITGNPAGIKKGIILSFLFFFLLVSAVYGQGGVVHTRSFVHDGVLRQYLLYVPAAYNTSEGDWPLVINYHGFTSSAALQMSVHSKMNFIADTAHFLVAYPQGLVVQDLVSGVSGTGWNIPGLYNASHDDVAFTDSLIDHVDADFRVELERVHTTGWSNGSEMVFYLACKLPDRIASVAGVSGLMSYDLLDSCDVERPFSTLLMHGTADPIYPFTGFPNFTPSAPTIPLFWASHNNCLDSIVTELPDINTTDNCTVTLIEYVNCDSAEVLFYRINNGGHAWPGGPYIPGILGNTNYDINGSSEIWNFFKRNPMPNIVPPGVVYERSFVQDDSLRTYLLYVPNDYTGQEDWPLVIHYHGFGIDAAIQMDYTNMNAVADTAHFLIAYPQGLIVEDLVFGGSGPGWNIPGSYNASHDDVAFTDNLIDHVAADFNIDFARIHATGWSNGSEMVFHLACGLPDRIASVAGVSGYLNYTGLGSCQVGRPFSTLLMFGTADPFIPFNTGIPGWIPPPPTTPSFWASHNNCSPDSIVTELPDIVTTDSSTVTLIEYQNCDPGAEVLFYRINDGGHPWPGSVPRPGWEWLGPTNQDISANSEIWNFFKRNPMPDSLVGIADHADHLTKTFRLYQNYPNPFNPVTTIKYSLLKPSQVELKIYNALGQLVKTLADGYQTTGEYSAVWDGKDGDGNLLSSGIYFYRIQMGEFSAVRKMAYLK